LAKPAQSEPATANSNRAEPTIIAPVRAI
jgi:hypothetical protein